MECTCPHGWWLCIVGEVYGPCSSDACGGACEPEGKCDCPLHADDPTHDSLSSDESDS